MTFMDKKDTKNNDAEKSYNNCLENEFVCRYCGRSISTEAPGTRHRNHCPWCLRSIHIDQKAGDRSSSCNGIMEPIAVSVRRGGEWILIHQCSKCGALKANRIAGDDNEMALLSLAVRPVAQLPFPIDGLYSEHEK